MRSASSMSDRPARHPQMASSSTGNGRSFRAPAPPVLARRQGRLQQGLGKHIGQQRARGVGTSTKRQGVSWPWSAHGRPPCRMAASLATLGPGRPGAWARWSGGTGSTLLQDRRCHRHWVCVDHGMFERPGAAAAAAAHGIQRPRDDRHEEVLSSRVSRAPIGAQAVIPARQPPTPHPHGDEPYCWRWPAATKATPASRPHGKVAAMRSRRPARQAEQRPHRCGQPPEPARRGHRHPRDHGQHQRRQAAHRQRMERTQAQANNAQPHRQPPRARPPSKKATPSHKIRCSNMANSLFLRLCTSPTHASHTRTPAHQHLQRAVHHRPCGLPGWLAAMLPHSSHAASTAYPRRPA